MAEPTIPVQILNLDSLVDYPIVKINGQPYQLLTRAMLPPLSASKIFRYGKRIEALVEKEDITKDEEAELDLLPKLMCELLLMAPAEVQEKLTDQQRMEIIASFTVGPWVMPATPRPTETAPTQIPLPTGVN